MASRDSDPFFSLLPFFAGGLYLLLLRHFDAGESAVTCSCIVSNFAHDVTVSFAPLAPCSVTGEFVFVMLCA